MSSLQRGRGGKALLDAAKLSFLLLLTFLPWMKHGLTIRGLEAFPSDFMFVITTVIWVAALTTGQARLRLHPSFLLLAAYLAAMALSAIFSTDRGLSAFKLLTQIYLLLLPVLAFNLVQTEMDLKRAFAWWLASAIAVGAYGVATILLFPVIGWHSFLLEPLHNFGTLPPGPYPRIELTFEYPAMLANYLGVSLMFLLLAKELGWISRPLSVGGVAAMLISAFFALTPGFGGILAMLALWLWYRERERKPRFAQAALVAALGLFVLEVLVAAVTPVVGPTAPFLIHVPGLPVPLAPGVRLLAWIAGFNNFLGAPLIGHGIGVDAVSVLYQARQNAATGYVTDAHNFILNIADECGILGVAALIGLVWFGVRQARVAVGGQTSPLLFGLSIAWLSGFAVQGLVGSFEDARHLWILFGLIASASRSTSSRAEPSPHPLSSPAGS